MVRYNEAENCCLLVSFYLYVDLEFSFVKTGIRKVFDFVSLHTKIYITITKLFLTFCKYNTRFLKFIWYV